MTLQEFLTEQEKLKPCLEYKNLTDLQFLELRAKEDKEKLELLERGV